MAYSAQTKWHTVTQDKIEPAVEAVQYKLGPIANEKKANREYQ